MLDVPLPTQTAEWLVADDRHNTADWNHVI